MTLATPMMISRMKQKKHATTATTPKRNRFVNSNLSESKVVFGHFFFTADVPCDEVNDENRTAVRGGCGIPPATKNQSDSSSFDNFKRCGQLSFLKKRTICATGSSSNIRDFTGFVNLPPIPEHHGIFCRKHSGDRLDGWTTNWMDRWTDGRSVGRLDRWID